MAKRLDGFSGSHACIVFVRRHINQQVRSGGRLQFPWKLLGMPGDEPGQHSTLDIAKLLEGV